MACDVSPVAMFFLNPSLKYTLGLFENSRNIYLMNLISWLQLCPQPLTTFTKRGLFFGLNFFVAPTFLCEKRMEVMLHKTFISTHFPLLGWSIFYSIWICMNIGNCQNDILHNHMIFVIRCCAYHIMTFKDTRTLHFSAGHDVAHFKDNDLPNYKLGTFWYLQGHNMQYSN